MKAGRTIKLFRQPYLRLAFTIMIARIVVNVPRRFAYPFLPEISRQLNVSLTSVQGVIATQAGVGVLAPVFAPLSTRRGRKQTLLFALGLLIVGALMAALVPRFGMFYIVMVVLGLAKIIFDPASHAYIGDQIPYNRRGTAIGIIELSWSLALVIGAPVAGYLLDTSGLRSIFLLIALCGLGSFILLWRLLPGDRPETVSPLRGDLANWRLLLQTPAAMGALAYALCLATANEMLFIVYGVWMERSFDLKLTTLGLVTIVIAVAEVIGELFVIGLADRLGKKTLTLTGALIAAIIYALLPYVGFNLLTALLLIFLLFVGVETAIVASFSLFTEVLPSARALMLTSIWSAHAIGRLLGAFTGGILYHATGSFAAAMLVSTILTLIAAFSLRQFVIDHHAET